MGLNFINEVTLDSHGAFVYTNSSALDYFIRRRLKDRLNANSDYIINVETDKELARAMDNGLLAPMDGDKWIIHVNMEKITQKVLEKVIIRDIPYAYFVFWVYDFKVLNSIKRYSFLKKYEQFYPIETLTYLTPEEADWYARQGVKDKFDTIKPDLYSFVLQNYRYDITALSEFIKSVDLGEVYKDRQEIIDSIGIGSISVDKLLIKLLTADSTTAKKAKNRLKDIVGYYDLLKRKYEPKQILNYLTIGNNNLLLLKQLYVMGYLKNHNVELPQYVDTKKIARYQRYTQLIQNEISMVDILNLNVLLRKYRDFSDDYNENILVTMDSEITFMLVMLDYLEYRKTATIPVNKKFIRGGK